MFLLILLPVCALARVMPTALQVVDLRGSSPQAELDTWLGSLQGTLNRQDDPTLVYLVHTDADAHLADELVAMYGLQKELLTPGALLELAKPALTGQVLYDPAQPWTRNIALTAAAVAPGRVIATASDLDLPTVLDLHHRWPDRLRGYRWAQEQYGDTVDQQLLALAPESGNQLADLIAARKLLAVDLAPKTADEAALLRTLIQHLPAGGSLLGATDDRDGDAESGLWQLTGLLNGSDHTVVPARNTANLSCFARLPLTRPLLQGHWEGAPDDIKHSAVLIYDGGSALNGAQSLDYATHLLPALLEDPALADVPVGVEVPIALADYAPGLYQLLLAHQRFSAAELVAAPNGDGWALPMAMPDPLPYLQRSATRAAALDLTSVSVFDVGGQYAYQQLLSGLAASGWRGALMYPVSASAIVDQQQRQGRILPHFAGLVGVARVRTAAELKAALAALNAPCGVIYLDPTGLPPSALRNMLPELTANHTLLTPAQALRALTEYAAVMPWLQAKQAGGSHHPQRAQPTLHVAPPTSTQTAPTAAMAIPVSVSISGDTSVLLARLLYQIAGGQVQTADLADAGNGVWTATLPPTLVGGALAIRARVVENDGFGITLSEPLILHIPVVDTDKDGAEDTLEAYRGTDPNNWDTYGDGLADGFQPWPLHARRTVSLLLPDVLPPDDTASLADAGASTADSTGRLIPAGTAITYHLPLKDLPASAPAAARVRCDGPGTLSVDGGVAQALAAATGPFTTDIPISAAQMAAKTLQVTLTAGAKPLRLLSLQLISNPDGPYFFPVKLTPAAPPADIPIMARVIVYTPKTVKTVRLRYGTNLDNLTTLELQPQDGTAGAVYAGRLPAQMDGEMLLYNIDAEDESGHHAASPFQVMPIGHPRGHSMSIIGTRDLQGSWDATPIWGNIGRSSVSGAAEDAFYFYGRPGTYTVWMLAQPRARGIKVKVDQHVPFSDIGYTRLQATLPAGSPDGWVKLGAFTVTDEPRSKIYVDALGASGYCAYGELVLTQDEAFTPPLTHSAVDWYNSMILTGVKNGQTVTGTLTLKTLTSGNIDQVGIVAQQITASNNVFSTETFAFHQDRDGAFTLDTRRLPPGEYDITASGLKTTIEDETQKVQPLVNVVLRVTVPRQ
jgi:hypothetical protein